MKNTFFTVLLLLVFGCFLYFGTKTNDEQIKFAYILPQDTVFLLHQKKMGSLLDQWKRNALGKTLRSLDYTKIGKQLGIDQDRFLLFDNTLKFIQGRDFQRLFHEFLSKEFSVAVIPGNGSGAQNGPPDLKNIIFYCNNRYKQRFSLFIERFFEKNMRLTTSFYGDHTIQHVQWYGVCEAFLVTVDANTLITFDKKLLYSLLDRLDKGGGSLHSNPQYVQLKEMQDDSNLFVYMNFSVYRDKLSTALYDSDNYLKKFFSEFEQWKHFGQIGITCEHVSSGTDIKFHLLYDGNGTNEVREDDQLYLQRNPVRDTGVVLAPQDTLFYYWNNFFNLETLWSIYKKESGISAATLSKIEMTVEMMTGESFHDFLALFGHQIHIYVSKHNVADPVPFPNFSIFFEVNDSRTIEKIVYDIFRKNTIPHRRRSYKGQEYLFWGENRLNGLQPVFGIIDGNFVISSSVAMHRALIDAKKGGDSLVESGKLGSWGDEFSLPSNSFSFSEVNPLIDVMQNLISWWGTMLAIQNYDNSQKFKEIAQDCIHPVLESFRMYNMAMTRTYMQKNSLIFEMKLNSQGEEWKN